MAKPKVYLSPSNQGLNLYATGNTNELHQCDKIAAAAAKAMERCGIEVMVGKSGDTMANRCRESDAFGADLHGPIHTNATKEHNVTGGTLVMLYKDSAANNKAGKAILDAVAKISPGPDYALQYRPELMELNTPKAISVYLEVEFHDTKTGSDWIRNNIQAIGEAYAKGACNYFGLKYKAPTDSTPAKDKTEEAKPSSSTLYRVWVGDYKKKDSASAQLKKVKTKGFEAILVKSGGSYKIQLGVFRSKPNAESKRDEAKAKGFSASVTTKSGEAVSSSASTTSKPKTIKEGSKVRLKDGARTYTGGWLAPFVYNRVHKVSELNGKRAVITYDGTVVAAVHVSDLILV